jgi:hypothetical protein
MEFPPAPRCSGQASTPFPSPCHCAGMRPSWGLRCTNPLPGGCPRRSPARPPHDNRTLPVDAQHEAPASQRLGNGQAWRAGVFARRRSRGLQLTHQAPGSAGGCRPPPRSLGASGGVGAPRRGGNGSRCRGPSSQGKPTGVSHGAHTLGQPQP